MIFKFSLKNIPLQQWVIILIAVIGVLSLHLYGQHNLHFAGFNTDQFNDKIMAAKLLNPGLYSSDPVFNDAHNMAFYSGSLFIQIIKPFLGSLDFYQAFSVFQPGLGIAYFLAMFALLYCLTGRAYVSAFVALVSGFQIEVFPLDYWSAYTIGDVLPRGFFLVVAPLLFMFWWEHYQLALSGEKNRLLWVYAVVGLAGNIHPVSWFGLTAVFLLTQILNERFSAASFKRAFVCGMVSSLPMLPYMLTLFFNAGEPVPFSSPAEFEILINALYYAFSSANPAILSHWTLGVEVAFGWILIALWSGLALRREIPVLLRWFAASCLAIFLGVYAFNAVRVQMHLLPVLVDAFRALRFILLPVFVLTALWLVRFSGRALLWRCGVVFLLAVVLHAHTFIKTLFINPVETLPQQYFRFISAKGFWVTPRQQEVDEWHAIEELSVWFKSNTQADALVHVAHPNNRTSLVVRALGERGVTYCYKDGGFLYYSNKPLMLRWFGVAQTMEGLHQAKGFCSESEWQYAQKMGATHLVCPNARNTGEHSDAMRAKMNALYENPFFVVYGL